MQNLFRIKQDFGKKSGECCVLTLVVLVLVILACPQQKESYAEKQAIKSPYAATSAISIAVTAEKLEFDLVPKAEGKFEQKIVDLTVDTNSKNGFTVLLQGMKGSDLESPAVDGGRIVSIDQEMTAEDFAANSWGYYVGKTVEEGTLYHPIPDEPEEIIYTENLEGAMEYKLVFGAKVDLDLPAGEYQNNLLVSAVANPAAVLTWDEMVYMQDMTGDICASVAPNTQRTLIDSRDDKVYGVYKLGDGNCWMTSNLQLSLSVDKSLTPQDSNVKDAWWPSATTATALTGSSANGSWSLRNIYGDTWYYSFDMATAGTGQGIGVGYASSDICPKGWQLPVVGTAANPANASFYTMIIKSGFTLGSVSTLQNSPFFYLYHGQYNGVSLQNVGQFGYYWTNTSAATASAYYMQINATSGVTTDAGGLKTLGLPIRCVAVGTK